MTVAIDFNVNLIFVSVSSMTLRPCGNWYEVQETVANLRLAIRQDDTLRPVRLARINAFYK